MSYILLVDDDPEVLGTVWRALTREGHDVTLSESAQQALEAIQSRRPDLILLDIMMADQDGLTFCRDLRADPRYRTIPILFLSARWHTDDIVEGLDAGGDDYLAKPFQLKELNARVRALLRRAALPSAGSRYLKVGGLQLDTNTFQLEIDQNDEAIQLTSTEFRLLFQLMSTPNRAHSAQDLLSSVWHYPAGTGDPDLVRAHIRNLRAKIEPDSGNPTYIQTIHGVGYMFRG